MPMNRMDRLALLNSEVFQELEQLTKAAQSTLSDKIIQSPTAQKAITDGITKALENKADDWDEEHPKIRETIKKLDDHLVFEFYKMFADELETRGINPQEYEQEFEDVEGEETPEDEIEEQEEMEEVLAYVVGSLKKLAEKSADNGNVSVAYMIERTLDRIIK